jgi:hypothetical protein
MLIIPSFYSLSVQFYLAHVVFGLLLPCYKPRERNFLLEFIFFYFSDFPAAIRSGDGRSGWKENETRKHFLGFLKSREPGRDNMRVFFPLFSFHAFT